MQIKFKVEESFLQTWFINAKNIISTKSVKKSSHGLDVKLYAYQIFCQSALYRLTLEISLTTIEIIFEIFNIDFGIMRILFYIYALF